MSDSTLGVAGTIETDVEKDTEQAAKDLATEAVSVAEKEAEAAETDAAVAAKEVVPGVESEAKVLVEDTEIEVSKVVIPLGIRFGVLAAEFKAIVNEALAAAKKEEAHVLNATAAEVAVMKARFAQIEQWASKRL